MALLCKLNTMAELEKVLKAAECIKLFGAGHYLNLFLRGVEDIHESYLKKIDFIMVSDTTQNAREVNNIPVISYSEAKLKMEDFVILTLGSRYADEVCSLLEEKVCHIYQIDFDIFHNKPYCEVKESLRPFIEFYPRNLLKLNEPVSESRVKAWTCWWQGEEKAPEIVQACWKSQKKYLPDKVEHVIITERNYKEYIELPEYVLLKVQQGYITLTTLSDILRASLLYKYGGFWLDATLLLVKPLEISILNFPIYTRNLPETQYCANAMWAGWFLYAQPGNKLFQFLSEAFFYYFSVHDNIKYYFMIDYIIAIACNIFPEIEGQLNAIPYNNAGAMELCKHLMEKYDEQRYKHYINNTCIQKLSYKESRDGCKMNTIYRYLINNI